MTRETIVPATGRFHAVRFYKDPDRLCRIVADFFGEGFDNGQPAVLVARAPHIAMIQQYLAEAGYDLRALERAGELSSLDSQDSLEQFVVDGLPDPRKFRHTLTPVLERAAGGRPESMVRVYGDMVDVLWQAGLDAAATRLEILWNALASTHPLCLLCGYALGRLHKPAAVNEICSLHSHVITDTGVATPVH